MTRSLRIGPHEIGPDAPPFVIAELSGNHGGSLERALQLVDAVAASGAHALKLQTYTADTMTLPIREREFVIEDEASLWRGSALHDLYARAHTPWDWHAAIFDRCRQHGLTFFSTPFDATAVDFLEALDVPCHKIASFENIDLPLVRKAASTGKPLIISTGMASLAEIDEAVTAARAAGARDLLLLKCTSAYPAQPEDSHLATIAHMRDAFGCPVGLSDHTLGLAVATAAVALGAVAIEKHVTVARDDGAVDSEFSLTTDELRDLVGHTDAAWRSVGRVTYGPSERERPSLLHRRTLYVTRSVKAGEAFGAHNVRAIRPGLGLAPRYLDEVLQRVAAIDLEAGTPLDWSLIGARACA
jgi:N-acetylneuraminate synthase